MYKLDESGSSPAGRYIARGVSLSDGTNQITARATNRDGDIDLQTISVPYHSGQAAPCR